MKIEKIIVSIGAITLPMLLFILAFSLKLTYMFYSVFQIQWEWVRLIASGVLALTVSLTMLTVSVNSELIGKKFDYPLFFAICSGIMWLIAFKVLDSETMSTMEYVKRSFLSLFLAVCEYVYSKLYQL